MSTNPSHILIARNSRSLNNPAAPLSSPTATHAAASGVFRSSTTPATAQEQQTQWLLEECSTDEVESVFDSVELDEIELEETFTLAARFPGTVKIVVEGTTFWAHKEILVFASPFFEAALSGAWLETNAAKRDGKKRKSISSVITISQPPLNPGDRSSRDLPPEMTFAPMDPEDAISENEIEGDEDFLTDTDIVTASQPSSPRPVDPDSAESIRKEKERQESLNQLLQGASLSSKPAKLKRKKGGSELATLKERNSKESTDNDVSAPGTPKSMKPIAQAKVAKPKEENSNAEAVILLKEEKAHIFHDFLRWAYPHLECTISWNNVEGLMNISHKLCVPSLQQQCLTFLITHAAGRAVKAMRIAELFEEEELYREGSRFVLDNPGTWHENEMNTLSQETLLKLERRRTWFLERVLKLGTINVAKEYQCCATCPDPPTCARILDEKWRIAYTSCFRFGPAQPSMVYRYLRGLEGISPPLSLTHLNCQITAKAFTATLFDRMFSLGVRGSGTDTAPLGARIPGAAPGPRRQFLYCSLKKT